MGRTERCLLCNETATYYILPTYHRLYQILDITGDALYKHPKLPVCEPHAMNRLKGVIDLVEKERPKGYILDTYAPMSIVAFENTEKFRKARAQREKLMKQRGLQEHTTAVRVVREEE